MTHRYPPWYDPERVRRELEERAAEGLERPAAYDIPEPTQRRWWRWLTTWGPRLVAALRGR